VGLAWSFFNPLFMLGVYTFVFSVIFKARWGLDESRTLFAIAVFVGTSLLGFFSEAINRAPSLINSNINYVKKVIFPIQILPVITIGSSLFHMAISFTVLFLMAIMFNGFLNWTIIWLPIILIPLIFFALGFCWFLSAAAVYLRDIGQTVAVLTPVLMFLSPVFFPVSAVPERFQVYIRLNPFTFIIEQARQVIILGGQPQWGELILYVCGSILVAWLGYAFFQKTRKGFADVL
jgi:lipopolysaccharide transport system permease protein